MLHVGRALGVKWARDDKPAILDPGDGPTIADLTDGVIMPVAGGDTLAASRAVLARLELATPPETPA